MRRRCRRWPRATRRGGRPIRRPRSATSASRWPPAAATSNSAPRWWPAPRRRPARCWRRWRRAGPRPGCGPGAPPGGRSWRGCSPGRAASTRGWAGSCTPASRCSARCWTPARPCSAASSSAPCWRHCLSGTTCWPTRAMRSRRCLPWSWPWPGCGRAGGSSRTWWWATAWASMRRRAWPARSTGKPACAW